MNTLEKLQAAFEEQERRVETLARERDAFEMELANQYANVIIAERLVETLSAALNEARDVVSAICGENQPSRGWAMWVRDMIDTALAQARKGR